MTVAQLTAWILKVSLLVHDAQGHSPTKPIAVEGAAAIADACQKVRLTGGTDPRPMCAAVYVVQAFRESGYNLAAVSLTDCRDHITGKIYTVPYGQPCRDGDSHVSFGPFQTQKRPATWAQAVADFTPMLQRSATECAEPLAMLASGSCTNKAGIAISRARMAEAKRLVVENPIVIDGGAM